MSLIVPLLIKTLKTPHIAVICAEFLKIRYIYLEVFKLIKTTKSVF